MLCYLEECVFDQSPQYDFNEIERREFVARAFLTRASWRSLQTSSCLLLIRFNLKIKL